MTYQYINEQLASKHALLSDMNKKCLVNKFNSNLFSKNKFSICSSMVCITCLIDYHALQIISTIHGVPKRNRVDSNDIFSIAMVYSVDSNDIFSR